MIRFVGWFLLASCFLLPLSLHGHEIHLKNGSVIKTDFIERKAGALTYRQFGGEVTIELGEVDKIVYSKGAELNNGPVPDSPGDEKQPLQGNDLETLLVAQLSPKGPIERANLCVVSIVTVSGSGTGFFINDEGLIVTNRHVLRGSKINEEALDRAFLETGKQLGEWKKRLDAEKEELDLFRNSLKRDWAEYKEIVKEYGSTLDQDEKTAVHNRLKERSRSLKKWQRDYQKRRTDYDAAQRAFSDESKAVEKNRRALLQQSRFTVILAGGQEKSALLYRISDTVDLALLKLNGYKTPFLTAAPRASRVLGQQVYAIGSPLNLNNSVTSGVISGFRGDLIQTNAEIYPGNSGGPLITETGAVVGVNSMKLITEKFEGIGFAIDINEVYKSFPEYF